MWRVLKWLVLGGLAIWALSTMSPVVVAITCGVAVIVWMLDRLPGRIAAAQRAAFDASPEIREYRDLQHRVEHDRRREKRELAQPPRREPKERESRKETRPPRAPRPYVAPHVRDRWFKR